MACGSRRDAVFLVFEYCEHDLAVLTDTNYNPFTESEIKTLIIQLLSAVSYLHANHIIHRDIKLSNLLYNHRGKTLISEKLFISLSSKKCSVLLASNLHLNYSIQYVNTITNIFI